MKKNNQWVLVLRGPRKWIILTVGHFPDSVKDIHLQI